MKYFLLVFLLVITNSFQRVAAADSLEVVKELSIVKENEVFYSTTLLDALTPPELEVQVGDDFRPMPSMSPWIQQKRDSMAAVMGAFEAKGQYADNFPDKVDRLPFGIKRTINNISWTLIVSNFTASAQGGLLTACLKVEWPSNGDIKMLYFGAEDIALNADGGIADMKLVLLGAFEIPMGNYRMVLNGAMDNTLGKSAPNSTYAIIGCQGLKQLNLVGEFEFSKNVLIPVKKNETNVVAPFNINVTNANDFLVQVTLPPFEVKGLKDVEFMVRRATLDLSDTRNGSKMNFPKGYKNKYYPGNALLWRGVYIDQLNVKLPEQFKNKNTGIRPEFSASDMIIDQQGVSGLFGVHATLLSLNEGSASGWKFSLDKVSIELEANRITGGSFGGQLVLPIPSKGKDTMALAYSAIITDQDEYILTAGLADSIVYELFSADLIFRKNSRITIALVEDNESGKAFKPMAVMNGTMRFYEAFKGTIDFNELTLLTEAPYIKIGGIHYTNQGDLEGFPVSISAIGLANANILGQDCLELKFTIAVCLDQAKINGSTTMSLSAYYDKANGSTDGKWKFHKFRIYDVVLNAEFGAMEVVGTIIFMQEDPLYGNGFYGHVIMTYNKQFGIESEVLFGARPDFRYWYVYARIDLPVPITVVGPFQIGAFGGGAYSRMSIAPPGSPIPYVPDVTAGFGVKALVGYVIAKREVCKGDLMFEINFNRSGGVKYIAFYGSAEIVAGAEALGGIASKMDEAGTDKLKATLPEDVELIASGGVQNVAQSKPVGKKPASSIFGYLGIQYNFETSTLEANSEIFITLGKLTGRGPNNRAGWMDLHIGPDRWYCYAGTPQDRLGIRLSIAGLQLETGSYFMVGSEMPSFPPPPLAVTRILGPELYPMQNNVSESSLKTGTGFAFGVDLSLHADVNFMILYASMTAGVGGDLMLRQYPDAHCEGSSSALGINSWYANGRVYTYLEGEIGVKVNLLFIKARIPILNGAAAAMLEGGGPNPTWAKGYLRVRFSVLGGKISGDMNMKMSLGDECRIVNNTQAPVNFKIISDITPVTNSTEVDVFTSPQIAFNVAVNEAFEVSEGEGSRLFRVKISSLKLLQGTKELAFTQAWTNRQQTLTLTPENSLPSESNIELKIAVEFEVQDNGWKPYLVNGTTPKEVQAITFKTSQAPTNIPHRNISYMYPAHQQKNVYKGEQTTGYIVLKQWQDYLLEGDVTTTKHLKLTSADGSQQLLLTPTFVRGEKKISFNQSGLQVSKRYTVELVTRPVNQQARTADTTSTAYGDEESGQYNLTENRAQNVVQNAGEKLLLDYGFTTSQYNTLALKIADIGAGISNKMIYLSNSDYVNVRTRVYEVFDSTELFGSVYTDGKPLISYQSLLTDNYYKNQVFPAIYKDYPYNGKAIIKDRVTSDYGFPPAKALYHDPEYELDSRRMPYINGLVEVYRKDYHDLEHQIMNQYVNGNSTLLTTYPQFFGRFPEAPLNNSEQIEFSYVLPGNKAGTKGVVNYKR